MALNQIAFVSHVAFPVLLNRGNILLPFFFDSQVSIVTDHYREPVGLCVRVKRIFIILVNGLVRYRAQAFEGLVHIL